MSRHERASELLAGPMQWRNIKLCGRCQNCNSGEIATPHGVRRTSCEKVEMKIHALFMIVKNTSEDCRRSANYYWCRSPEVSGI
ncbi:hypothetical protein B0H12DRAFT_1100551 [Mycena haematopus]|nr:hypothetical protein B0H12DRAFT_1100551 [Mycena haematopus]